MTRFKKQRIDLLLKILFMSYLSSLCFSCTRNVFYDQYQIITGLWEKEKEYYFTYSIDDNDAHYNISVKIRNNNYYPYQNLWLFCTEEQPVGPARRDTIECILADDYGKWYGTGISIYNSIFSIRKNYIFPYKGQYTFTIQQGMREDRLNGIEEVGLIIEKID